MDKDKIKSEIKKLATNYDTFVRSRVLQFYLDCVEAIENSSLSDEVKFDLDFEMKKLREKSDKIDFGFVRFGSHGLGMIKYIDEYVLPHKQKLVHSFLHILTMMGKDAKLSAFKFLLQDVYFADVELFDLDNHYEPDITLQYLFNSKLIRCRSYILDSADFYTRMNPFLENVMTLVDMERTNAQMFVIRRSAEAIEKEIDLVQYLTDYFKKCLFSEISAHRMRYCLRDMKIFDFVCIEGCIPYKGNKYTFYQIVQF